MERPRLHGDVVLLIRQELSISQTSMKYTAQASKQLGKISLEEHSIVEV